MKSMDLFAITAFLAIIGGCAAAIQTQNAGVILPVGLALLVLFPIALIFRKK
jgi:hypothetical protein